MKLNLGYLNPRWLIFHSKKSEKIIKEDLIIEDSDLISYVSTGNSSNNIGISTLTSDNSYVKWNTILPKNDDSVIGFILIGDMKIPSSKKINSFRLYMLKIFFGIKWEDKPPPKVYLTEEQKVNKDRFDKLNLMLKKENFWEKIWK